jgi:hypothetical protein
VVLTFMLTSVQCVPKPAIAVRLSATSMTMNIARSAPKLAVVVLNLAAKWQPQWLKVSLFDLPGKLIVFQLTGMYFDASPVSFVHR